MPDVRNCRRCGKIFTYLGGPPICTACKSSDEEDFKRVKQYLYDNSGATLSQVSNDLEISVEKIKRFLKDGRLEIVGEDGNMFLECESCGKAIKSGRLCGECEKGLANTFKAAADQMKSEIDQSNASKGGGIGMRYLNKDEQKRAKE